MKLRLWVESECEIKERFLEMENPSWWDVATALSEMAGLGKDESDLFVPSRISAGLGWDMYSPGLFMVGRNEEEDESAPSWEVEMLCQEEEDARGFGLLLLSAGRFCEGWLRWNDPLCEQMAGETSAWKSSAWDVCETWLEERRNDPAFGPLLRVSGW